MKERLASALQRLAAEFGNAELAARPWLSPGRELTTARWRFALGVEESKSVWFGPDVADATQVTLEVDLGRRREVAPPLSQRMSTYYALADPGSAAAPRPAASRLDRIGLYGDYAAATPTEAGVVVVDPAPDGDPEEPLVALQDAGGARTLRTRGELRGLAREGAFVRPTYRRWVPSDAVLRMTHPPIEHSHDRWVVGLEAELGGRPTTWLRPWRAATRTWSGTPFPIALLSNLTQLRLPPWGPLEDQLEVVFPSKDSVKPEAAVTDGRGRHVAGGLPRALLHAGGLLASWWRDELHAPAPTGRYAGEWASSGVGGVLDDIADAFEYLEQALPVGWALARFAAQVRSDPAPGREPLLQARLEGQVADDQHGLLAAAELVAPPFVRARADGRGMSFHARPDKGEDGWVDVAVDLLPLPSASLARAFFGALKTWARVGRPTG